MNYITRYRDDILEPLAHALQQARSAGHGIPKERGDIVAVDMADDKDL